MPNLSFTTAFPVAFTKIKSADMTSWLTDIQTLLNTTKLDSTNVQANALTLDRLAAATAADGFVVANASKNLTHTADPALPFVNLSQDPAAPATSHIKLYAKSSKLYTMNEAGAVSQVGTGAGASATQYITNPSAANDTSGWAAYNNTFTATISIASPAVVTATAHGMNSGDLVAFTTTGALPTGITAGTNYRVSKIDANTFNLLDASSGAQINTSGTQSGTQTAHPVQPITGTGGTPAATLARTTTSPLNGVSSFLYTPGTSGEGVSTALTINRIDLTSPLQVEVDVEVASGTYTDGDVAVWIVDTSTGNKIQPAPYQILKSTGPQKFVATFQGTGNSSLQFCIHQATGNNSYTLRFQASVTNLIVPTGAVVTDWVAYTPTFTGFGTVTNIAMESRRVGDSLQVRGTFQVGTTTAVTAQMTLGFDGGSSNITTRSGLPTNNIVGKYSSDTVGTTYFGAGGVIASSGNNYVLFGSEKSSTQGNAATTGSVLFGNNSTVSVFAEVPVQGWSSNVQVSSSADTRLVLARVASLPSGNPGIGVLNYQTVQRDTHGAYSGGTYTCPVPGEYEVSILLYNSATSSSFVTLQQNGTDAARLVQTSATSGIPLLGSATVTCKAGDTLRLYNNNVAITTGGTETSPTIQQATFKKLSGPAQISASETVACRYTNSAGTTINTSQAQVPFATKDYDSHGAFNGSTFTAPMSGTYSVKCHLKLSSSVALSFYLYKNGSGGTTVNGVDYTQTGVLVDDVKLLAGETLQIWAAAGSAVALSVNAFSNTLAISRVGNY